MKKHLKNYPRRGEIYVADLDPAFGRELHKKRPVLIISSDTLNQNSNTVIMLPLSSIVPKFIGPDVVRSTEVKGLDKDSIILVSQIRAIDKDRLIKKVDKVKEDELWEVEEALKLVLGMTPLDN